MLNTSDCENRSVVESQARATILEVCESLMRNGWIRSYRLFDDGALDVAWNYHGAVLANGMRGMCRAFRLFSYEFETVRFSRLVRTSHRQAFEFAGRTVPEPLQDYWLSCEEAASIEMDHIKLSALVKIVMNCIPDLAHWED